MSQLTKNAGYYPRSNSVVQEAANKVITRVVSDGINLRDAVREAIKIANFNQQDTFALLCTLESFGMVHYGDYKNYWSSGWGQGIGEAGVDTNMGTNFYAANKQKVVTAETKIDENFVLFAEINKLRSLGMTAEEIKTMNPELEFAVDTMEETDAIIASVTDELFKTADGLEGVDLDVRFFENLLLRAKPIWERVKASGKKGIGLEDIIVNLSGGKFPNIDWNKATPFIKKFIPDYEPLSTVEPKGMQYLQPKASITTAQVAEAPAVAPEVPAETPAPQEELVVEEPEIPADIATEAPAEEVSGGSISAEVTPSPEEIEEMAQQGPEWQIENLLSIEKALNYYEELSKQLEDVVFNPNLKLSMDDVSKYDKIRNAIDGEINKINEAQKGKEKIEKKEDQLKEEVEQPSQELTVEEPVAEVPAVEPAPVQELEVTE